MDPVQDTQASTSDDQCHEDDQQAFEVIPENPLLSADFERQPPVQGGIEQGCGNQGYGVGWLGSEDGTKKRVQGQRRSGTDNAHAREPE